MTKKIEILKQKIANRTRIAQAKAAKELSKIIPDVIKLRTRQEGEDKNNRPLKNLEASTKEYRERYQDNLHPDTSPGTSNLTATGQLLDSIQGRSTGSKVSIEIKGGRRRGELSGSDSRITNKKLRKYVEDQGREFLQLSEAEREEAKDLARQIILDEIRSVIK
jgi:hypothetical protein